MLPPFLCLHERQEPPPSAGHQGSVQRWDLASRVVRTQVHRELSCMLLIA